MRLKNCLRRQHEKYNKFKMYKRSRRSLSDDNVDDHRIVKCPRSYCKHGEIENFCIPTRKCPNHPNLPYTSYLTTFRSESSPTHRYFRRFMHQDIFCIPICLFDSLNSRMPTIEQVSSTSKMCDWYYKHGMCPYFFAS